MNKKKIILLLSTLVIGLLMLSGIVYAQTGGGYDLSWWTIDSGGGEVSGGGYSLNGTVGQHDSHNALTGGGYSLTGGFWASEDTAATCPNPFNDIIFSGPSFGIPNEVLTYHVTLTPTNASPPNDYNWTPDGLQSGQGTATATYKWSSTGTKSVDVTVENCDNAGGAGDGTNVTIGYRVYLPLVLK